MRKSTHPYYWLDYRQAVKVSTLREADDLGRVRTGASPVLTERSSASPRRPHSNAVGIEAALIKRTKLVPMRSAVNRSNVQKWWIGREEGSGVSGTTFSRGWYGWPRTATCAPGTPRYR